MSAQTPRSLADERWTASETPTGRFVIVPGERAFVAGYSAFGLEVWTSPLQLVRGYWVSFQVDSEATVIDGRSVLRDIESTPMATTRVYVGPGFAVRERIFTAVDPPAATISYRVESSRPIAIIVHFTPSLNLMWPGAVGGQEIHWDSTHSAYVLDEPSHRFRGVILSRQVVAHEQIQNDTRGTEFERSLTFTLRPSPNDTTVSVTFAGTSTPETGDALGIAESLASRPEAYDQRARERYADMHVIEIETPDSAVNRALRWAQVTLEQAWACNPQLGCGLVAGYGPSRGARRPQYAWFFANDGLVAVDALLREGAHARAREELEFIIRRQNAHTGMIWHELSQSAGFLDWQRDYPYMFAHVDITFDFLSRVRDYVVTTGDVAFAREHWRSIQAAYDYCRSTIPPNGVLPVIPAGQQGRDEQDPQRDELSLSLAWVEAAESFAALAGLTNHVALAASAQRASALARDSIRPAYYDERRGRWVSGHLRSGAPVEGLTGGLTALLHHGLLNEREQRALLDSLASPVYRTTWGIRSTPSNSPFYDPDSYARGSVWAIGTADAIMAFYQAGRGALGTALWRDLVPWFELDAPGHMHEVLRGDAFVPERESVPDQSWSASSFLTSAVRGVLGIEIDGNKRELRFAPRLPVEWDRVRVRRLVVGGRGNDVGLVLRRSTSEVELEIENGGPALTLIFQPSLPNEARVTRVDVSGGARLERSVGDAITISCPPRMTSRVVVHRS